MRIPHHLAYLCSVFRPSPFCQAAVGSSTTREVRSPSAWKIGRRTRSPPMTGARSRPFTRKADREGLACLAKQLWRGERGRPVGLGMFYFLLTQAIFPGESNEGTVIELAPYGDRRARRLPDLHVACGEVGMPDALRGPAARPSSGPRSAGGASTWSTRTAPSPVIKAGPTAPSTIGGRRRARGRRHANMVRPAAAPCCARGHPCSRRHRPHRRQHRPGAGPGGRPSARRPYYTQRPGPTRWPPSRVLPPS